MFAPLPSLLAYVFCACALAASACGQAATRPKGFAGITFGASPEEVWRVLGARSGMILPAEVPAYIEVLELSGGTFAGQEAMKWTFEFAEKKFCGASVTLKPGGNPTALLRELKQQLIVKYGAPTNERKAGSGNEKKERKETVDKDTFGSVTTWKFPPVLGDKSAKSVVCEAAGPGGSEVADKSQLQITLRYSDDTLRAPLVKAGGPAAAKITTPLKVEDL